ncbi:type II secretion system protein [Parasulfuritortus cantonensis]|uniref:Type II secretion system protein n=1 Tax=Parasulfuritortus cantonensis TaxID=2528202 RepID=A0A4R1BAF5_9PROT|nr:type II secretion system protein [Parasulfuritortus cantonensis]TCJ13907.1 type II secretion system protein [Parasulfuritortus cantonensis]
MVRRTPAGERGFTLLWLLFLVAGMGVGLAALGTVWHTAAQREKEKELLFAGLEYRRAIASFWQAVPGQQRLPRELRELLRDPRFPTTVRHLRRLYPDPMNNGQDWGLVRDADGGIAGVYSRSDAKPFKTTGFPAGLDGFAQAESYRDWVFQFQPPVVQPVARPGSKAAHPEVL